MNLSKQKVWLKKNFVKCWQKVVNQWHNVPNNTRLKIISLTESVLNYLANAILISVPLTFFSFTFEGFTIKRYLIMVLCIWVSQPFIEHYYVWFRELWKESINK